MRNTILTVGLVMALATPALATTGSPESGGDHLNLPIYLAATSTPAPWFTSGVVAGRFGGVPVVGSFTGTSAIGIISLTVHRATFAYGSYMCLRKLCTFTGTLAGVRVKNVPLPLSMRGASRGAVTAFPTRHSWIAAVASWAKQHLGRDQRDRIVAEAAKIPGS